MASQKVRLPKTIRTDPELGRLCVALSLAPVLRLWIITREITRQQAGSGCITKQELKHALKHYNCAYSNEHFSRLLKQGEGVFWNRDQRRIFMRKPAHVVQDITRQALELNPDMIYTNRPGCHEVYLDPSGSLEQWEVNLYLGWLTHRGNPTISRQTLSMLFQRDVTTLLRWERDHLQDNPKFIKRKNYAQSVVDPNDTEQLDLVPNHAHSYVAAVGPKKSRIEMRAMWQLPNNYIIKHIRHHPRRGQGYATRRIVNQIIDEFESNYSGQPPTSTVHRPASFLGSFYTMRRYFDTSKHLKRYLKKDKVAWGYLWRGENRHGHGILEPSLSGYADTKARERLSFKHEYAIFKEKEKQNRAWLEEWHKQNNRATGD